jgi:hypothetical protein
MLAGVDWIDGGISDHHGLIAHYSPTGGACYECNFTASTIERFNRRYSCPYGLAADLGEEKVPTTAITTSVIASIQVQQALLRLHGINEESLSPGERLLVYLKPFRMIQDQLPYNSECEAHVTLPSDINLLDGSNKLTLSQLFSCANDQNPGLIELTLPYDFVTNFYCSACDVEAAVNRPKELVSQSASHCERCGQLREPRMAAAIKPNTVRGGLTLKEIGIAPRDILTFRTNEGDQYFQLMS